MVALRAHPNVSLLTGPDECLPLLRLLLLDGPRVLTTVREVPGRGQPEQPRVLTRNSPVRPHPSLHLHFGKIRSHARLDKES